MIKGASIAIMFTILFPVLNLYGQQNSFKETEIDLTRTSSKVFSFYQSDYDSLELYSNLFTNRLTDFITKNPSTLEYPFQMLSDSNACGIVTSPDGLFRIYSWDTWLGGTMHHYKNIYQFRSAGKTYSTDLGYEDDMGGYFTDIFSMLANDKTYYLVMSGSSLSSKYKHQLIRIYTIDNNTLNDTISLIKTSRGLVNSIGFEYDFFSVYDRPERPLRLIKYNGDKKTIYIPVVLEDGKVTDQFILYQFTGEYFEREPIGIPEQKQFWSDCINPITNLDKEKLRQVIHFPLEGEWRNLIGADKPEEELTEKYFFDSIEKLFYPEFINQLKKQTYKDIQAFEEDDNGEISLIVAVSSEDINDGPRIESASILRFKKTDGKWKLYEFFADR